MAVINLANLYNPYTDLLQSIGQVINNIVLPYMLNKDQIDRLSDVELSDEKEKIKKILPDVITQDGKIDWDKVQELSTSGNKYAEHILQVKKNREEFAKSGALKKLQIIQDPEVVQSAYQININPEAEKRLERVAKALEKLAEKNEVIKQYIDMYGGDSKALASDLGITLQGLIQYSLMDKTLNKNQQPTTQPQQATQQEEGLFQFNPDVGYKAINNSFPIPTIQIPYITEAFTLPTFPPPSFSTTKRKKKTKQQKASQSKQKEIPVIIYPNELPPLLPKTRQQDDKVRIWNGKEYKTVPNILDFLLGQ